MTGRIEDLLTTAVRERAYAYAALADAHAEADDLRAALRDARLDLNIAHELLAYHNITPVEEAS